MMRVAIVHDYLLMEGGAEVVLRELLDMFPDADLYTLLYDEDVARRVVGEREIHASWLQRLPWARRNHRRAVPLMPFAARSLDLSGYDLVISSSHAFAKGVRTGTARHVCYCHSPMRWAWDLREQYLDSMGIHGVKRIAVRLFLAWLRRWDRRTNRGVDQFVANSKYIRDRIRRAYDRDAVVVYPPVPLPEPVDVPRGEHFVVFGRLVPYKRVDLIVDAFRELPGLELVVIGDGPVRAKLEDSAPPNVRFLGHLPRPELERWVASARATITAAEEDFGIATVESLALGTPVIGFAKGGTAEVLDSTSAGILISTRAAAEWVAAIKTMLEKPHPSKTRLISRASEFSDQLFRLAMFGVCAPGKPSSPVTLRPPCHA